ncbi:LacI family DNA-binding transcriptional regulator [Azospirillum aestuarii]|uniref:LacI family DNA-binding transcriptional regulator n=1 Tax=Azospirillum aestuarii TaxID=2802052 RepID=UPI004054FE8B
MAKLAGVSQSAVSRCFTDEASVSPQMRARVLEAAERLAYRPNAIARSLTTQRTNLVGIVMAFGALDAARTALGLRVPEDVSIVGFDDVPMAAWPSFALTTVHNLVDIIVATLMGMLERRLAEPQVARSCTAPPPAGAPGLGPAVISGDGKAAQRGGFTALSSASAKAASS